MSQELQYSDTREMFLYIADQIIASKPLLTQIDSEIGDGDHGIGMEIGFTGAREQLSRQEEGTINDIFTTTGSSMLKSMGGASGVIFGTLFSGGVKHMPPMKELDLRALAEIFQQGLDAVVARGKAKPGDKTVVDALAPAASSLQRSLEASHTLTEALRLAAAAAEEGVEQTKGYVARFGRAKSLGERAIGHQDAGATSLWIIVRSMHEWISNNTKVVQ